MGPGFRWSYALAVALLCRCIELLRGFCPDAFLCRNLFLWVACAYFIPRAFLSFDLRRGRAFINMLDMNQFSSIMLFPLCASFFFCGGYAMATPDVKLLKPSLLEDESVAAPPLLELDLGWTVGEAEQKAFASLQMASARGEPKAQARFGEMLHQDGNKARGLKLLKSAASLGDADAQSLLGDIYYECGFGDELKKKKGIEYYKLAVASGHAGAQSALGHIYAVEGGHMKAQSKDLFELAAAAGNLRAQYLLGEIYYSGDGVKKNKSRGRELLERAANSGYQCAQVRLAGIYYEGEGVKKDEVRALKWYQLAAQRGDHYAQGIVAIHLYEGRAIAKDKEEGLRLLRRAAERRNLDASWYLGEMLYYGCGVEKDEEKGLQLISQARYSRDKSDPDRMDVLIDTLGEEAARGEARKIYHLGLILYDDGGFFNRSCGGLYFNPAQEAAWEEGFRCFERAAALGYVRAQYRLGCIFADFEADEKKAVEYFQLAADKGELDAQYRLGGIFNGGSALRDRSKSLDCYRRAAEAGHVAAQYRLAQMLYSSRNDDALRAEGLKWYQIAAENGDMRAQSALGEIFCRGDGSKKNVAAGIKWYRRAADAGDADARFRLADIYYHGEGVEKNQALGLKFLKLAAADAHYEALDILASISAKAAKRSSITR